MASMKSKQTDVAADDIKHYIYIYICVCGRMVDYDNLHKHGIDFVRGNWNCESSVVSGNNCSKLRPLSSLCSFCSFLSSSTFDSSSDSVLHSRCGF